MYTCMTQASFLTQVYREAQLKKLVAETDSCEYLQRSSPVCTRANKSEQALDWLPLRWFSRLYVTISPSFSRGVRAPRAIGGARGCTMRVAKDGRDAKDAATQDPWRQPKGP